MENSFKQLLLSLTAVSGTQQKQKCCVGFDGYVDKIYRVVKQRGPAQACQFFCDIGEFGDKIKLAAGKSADIETLLQQAKMGGNAPLTANSIATLGLETVCMGLLGESETEPVFCGMSPNCHPICLGSPCSCIAFEFDDGKLMFGELTNLNRLDWELCKAKIGVTRILDIFDQSDLIAILNWSATLHLNEILTGIMDEVLPHIDEKKLQEKIFFFDLSDPSARTCEEIHQLIDLLHVLCQSTSVVLSVNENELHALCRCMNMDETSQNAQQLAEALYVRLGISVLLVHLLNRCIGIFGDGTVGVDGIHIKQPTVSTGGGDHFNGGFCVGMLLGFPPAETLALANATAAYYVSFGHAPTITELQAFLIALE